MFLSIPVAVVALKIKELDSFWVPDVCSVAILFIFSGFFSPLQEAKEIDVGVVGAEDIKLVIHEMDIKIIVKNLLDNAIRYTPFGGKIDLSVKDSENGVILQIDDSGPGISEDERERVLDPFYRVLGNDEVGSGLGLSIVQAIANRVGADIKLGYGNEQLNLGLRVKMIFPVALRCR